MRMELLDNGCLKILLTGEDLRCRSLSFDTLDYRDSHTREALHALLEAAQEQVGFPPTEHLLIEALPVEDGCLLLVTPEKSGCRLRLKTAKGPYIYRLDNAERLLQLADGLSRLYRREAALVDCRGSSLYRAEDGYRLILYAPKGLSGPVRRLLTHLAEPEGEGDAAAAFVEEHAAAVSVGDALPRLIAGYSD